MTTADLAIVVSVIAASIALLSAVYARRVADIEKARREEEVQATRVASLTGRIETWEHDGARSFGSAARLVIRNGGPAVAYDIRVASVHPKDHGPIDDRNFPIAELAAGEEWHETASFVVGDDWPYECVLTWRDGRGMQERALRLLPQHLR
jgi:hypothetical protein